MLLVMQKRCDQCLFSDAKVVCDDRKRDVLRECVKKDAFFVCHKAPKYAQVCCRGFYDKDPEATNLMRIAHRLDVVQFVPAEALARLERPRRVRANSKERR